MQALAASLSARLALTLNPHEVDDAGLEKLGWELEAAFERSRTRAIPGPLPCVLLDATEVVVNSNGQRVRLALVLAVTVDVEGAREVLGWDVGPSEDPAHWIGFLRGLADRGLKGSRLAIEKPPHLALFGQLEDPPPSAQGRAGFRRPGRSAFR